jgi:hypothetical protein
LKSLEKSEKYEKKHQSKPVDLEERPRKRKYTSPESQNAQPESTPRKAAKGPFTTPSKPRAAAAHPSDVDPYDSPSALRRLFSPSTHQQSSSPLKTAIGPTPQRDGKALGLFDLLSESGGSTATPTATRIASMRGEAAQTPSKKRALDTITEEEEEDDSPRGERTPASASKSYFLSALFATPTTWRYATMMDDRKEVVPNEREPQTSADDAGQRAPESETPAFLRRSNSARYSASNPTGDGLSPINVRKRPQFVGKGLSALVQGLRDMEEERLDDELDVLRELEAEHTAMNTEVTDSQTVGNDTGRTFKKKGQKRTTRRVHMKPVVLKPKNGQRVSGSEHEDDTDDEPAAVAETQLQSIHEMVQDVDEAQDLLDAASLHSISEPEHDSDSDYEDQAKPLARSKSFSERLKEAIGVPQPQPADSRDKKPQPQVKEKETKRRERKINPQAHANYRSLKIRNRNSKGRGAGRFGRRR